MEKSSEHHHAILKELCRICGQRAQTKKEKISKPKRQPKSVKSCESKLMSFYGVNIQIEDPHLFPDKLCTICYRRLINFKHDDRPEWKNHYVYKDDAMKTNDLWKPHLDSSCLVCSLYEYQKTAPSRQTFLMFMSKSQGKKIIHSFIICGTLEWGN